jgi:DNA-binding CsgD family transcriptional regulator
MRPTNRRQPREIDWQPPMSSSNPMSDVVLTVGHKEFASCVSNVVQNFAPHDIIGAYFIDPTMTMRVMFTGGGIPAIPDFPQLASQHYASRFWKQDPAVRRLFDWASGADRTFVVCQRWDEIPNGEYRSFAYEQPSMLERVSLFRTFSEGSVLLSFYRSNASNHFSSDELGIVEMQADILAAATVRHFQLCRSQAVLRPVRSAIAMEISRWLERLSVREVEVCSALLSENSVKQAIRTAGIKTSTFLTYRKRAFAKLKIQTRVDLERLYERRFQ